MKISLTPKAAQMAPGLAWFIERHVRLAVGRFAGRVRRVAVLLSEAAGPWGRSGQRCRITLLTDSSELVVVEAIQDRPEEAVARAARRAAAVMEMRLSLKGGPD